MAIEKTNSFWVLFNDCFNTSMQCSQSRFDLIDSSDFFGLNFPLSNATGGLNPRRTRKYGKSETHVTESLTLGMKFNVNGNCLGREKFIWKPTISDYIILGKV